MSADSVMMPASSGPPPACGNDSLVLGAVDTFEITARLEASGLSDRTVRRRYGASDVFAYAQSFDQLRESTQVPQRATGWLGRDALFEAVRRGMVLILGAVLAGLTATVMAVDTRDILVAGIGAWVIGQSVSGIVWAHAGSGQLKCGIARGTGATILVAVVLACAIAASLWLPGHDATMAGLTLAWCWYSCIVSMLVIIGRSWYLLTVLAVAVSAATLALVDGHEASTAAVLTAGVLVLAALTLALARYLRTISERYVPGRGDWRAVIAPAAQAGFLAAALTVALTRLPSWEGTALIVAGVVAAGATDPALVLMRQRLVWSSTRTPLLQHAARNARLLTMVMSAAIIIISGSVAALVVTFLVEETKSPTTVIVAAAFSSLATTSTTLNAFGLPGGAVIFAGAACLSAAAWIMLGNIPGIVLAMAFLVAGTILLLTRVSDPRAYA